VGTGGEALRIGKGNRGPFDIFSLFVPIEQSFLVSGFCKGMIGILGDRSLLSKIAF
jgi:hypothetical protein